MGALRRVLPHGGGNPCLVDGRPCAAPGDLGAAGTARRHAFPRNPRPTAAAMKHIIFHLDFVSPYAWLAFERLPDVLEA